MKNKTSQHRKKRPQKSNNNRPYWFAMGAVGLATCTAAGAPAAAQAAYAGQGLQSMSVNLLSQNAATLRFDIAAGTLGEVIAAYQKTSSLRVLFGREGFEILPSPGIKGDFSAERALQQILAGTGVAYRFTAADTITLDLQTLTTAVDVSTPAPGTALSSAKYTETLREIPQTIEVIPQAILQEQGAVTLSDALRNVPGITLQAGEGGGASSTTGDMFNLRGFNASNSIFVDGVRDDGLMSRNLFNLEQVEIFLGPTGSDVGRGTASGYVNMQTKVPSLRPGYSGTFAYDNADQKRGTMDFNHGVRLGPVGSWLSRAAVRLNALWQQGGVVGRDIVKLKNRAVAPSLGIGLGTATRATFATQITRQNNLPDYGIPGAAWSPEPLAATTVRATRPVDQSNFYGSIGYDYDKVSQESYTARVEHDVNDNFTLRYQTRYNHTHRDAVVTALGAFTPV